MTAPSALTMRVPARFQGPTGMGQGGWAAGRISALLEKEITTRFRAPIPLDSDMRIEPTADGWACTYGDTWVLEASPMHVADWPSTAVVTIDEAEAGRHRCPWDESNHLLPHCFSCGIGEDSMRVHPGFLDDGHRLDRARLGSTGRRR